MITSRKLESMFKIKKSNTKKMLNILEISMKRVVNQKSGCFIPGYGVAYIDSKNGTRDVIGHMVGYADIKNFWGPISGELQKPIVNKIRKLYQIDISVLGENGRLVNFLDELQQAHDKAFCEFNSVITTGRMQKFIDECLIIKSTLAKT